MFGQRELRGSTQDERSDLHEALQPLARGKIKPRLETYPLSPVNEVRERLAAGKVRLSSAANPRALGHARACIEIQPSGARRLDVVNAIRGHSTAFMVDGRMAPS
jgi:hypothetical protein